MTANRAGLPLRLAAVAAAALGLAAGGCGESRKQASTTGLGGASASTSPAQTAAGQPAPANLTVSESEFSLTPANATVPRAGTITISIRNAGSVQHALEVHGASGQVRTGPIAPGGSAELKLNLGRPGRYEWYCPIDGHRGRGMRGTIVVGPALNSKQHGQSGATHNGSGKKSGGGSSGGGGSSSGGAGPGPSNAPQDGGYSPG